MNIVGKNILLKIYMSKKRHKKCLINSLSNIFLILYYKFQKILHKTGGKFILSNDCENFDINMNHK